MVPPEIMNDLRNSGSTKQEMLYIEHMGRNVWYDAWQKPKSRIRMLREYKKGALLRNDWGIMDREIVLHYVDEQIMEERKNGEGT